MDKQESMITMNHGIVIFGAAPSDGVVLCHMKKDVSGEEGGHVVLLVMTLYGRGLGDDCDVEQVLN